mmetsp:Transcript_42834/g.50094  ORF Transcript_42834/g.50094 Transcript_42834/m.50094 type:complete len:84 (+) Transcript_42834:267-518(+)
MRQRTTGFWSLPEDDYADTAVLSNINTMDDYYEKSSTAKKKKKKMTTTAPEDSKNRLDRLTMSLGFPTETTVFSSAPLWCFRY